MEKVHSILYSMSLLSTDVISTAQYVITVGTLQYIVAFTDKKILLYIISKGPKNDYQISCLWRIRFSVYGKSVARGAFPPQNCYQ